MCNQIMCICKCKCKYSENRELRRSSFIKVLHFSLLTHCDIDTGRRGLQSSIFSIQRIGFQKVLIKELKVNGREFLNEKRQRDGQKEQVRITLLVFSHHLLCMPCNNKPPSLSLDFPDKKSRVPSHSFGAQYIEQAGGYNAATQNKDWKAYLLQ